MLTRKTAATVDQSRTLLHLEALNLEGVADMQRDIQTAEEMAEASSELQFQAPLSKFQVLSMLLLLLGELSSLLEHLGALRF
jgi:hypothetical protein